LIARMWVAGAAALMGCGLVACAERSPEKEKCEGLERLVLEHATITSVRASSAGHDFSLAAAFMARTPFLKVPAVCRVELVLKPSDDSHIKSEVWLPRGSWNGKFQGLGNGGFAGSIDHLQLILSVQQGYAVAATDTGHESSDKDGSWALGHPEKVRDYGYRGIHETAVAAKALIAAYYGQPARYAYFSGCSNGGRAALMEAQRYPEDYDGIVAGAPAYDSTNTLPSWAWNQKTVLGAPGAFIPSKKFDAIAAAVVKACDSLDGVADGVLDDPRNCTFRPESMLCKSEDADDCLTAPQAQALAKIYEGPGGALGDSRHHGFEPGAELGTGGWKDWIGGSKPGDNLEHIYALQFYRYLVYDDPDWNLDRFEFSRDRPAMQARIGEVLDARDPDLSKFKQRGGKLILYHGWSDSALQPRLAVDYFEAVKVRLGEHEAAQFVRLYMVPGMQHCVGGPGPNNFGQMPPAGTADPERNVNAALEAWVEEGRPPDAIVAAKYYDDWKSILAPEKTRLLRSRPLCPYPQVARWKGQGNTDAAENFSCVAPPREYPAGS
jgi:Tannase and feruloyl esterase